MARIESSLSMKARCRSLQVPFWRHCMTAILSQRKAIRSCCQLLPQILAARTMGTNSLRGIFRLAALLGHSSANHWLPNIAAYPKLPAASDLMLILGAFSQVLNRNKLRPFHWDNSFHHHAKSSLSYAERQIRWWRCLTVFALSINLRKNGRPSTTVWQQCCKLSKSDRSSLFVPFLWAVQKSSPSLSFKILSLCRLSSGGFGIKGKPQEYDFSSRTLCFILS